MAYLEELLPEFRKGAKIRKKIWDEGLYLYYKDGFIYDQYHQPFYNFSSKSISENCWEFYQEPIDWDHIIKNKCLCAFWNKKGCEFLGFLKQRTYYEDTDFYVYISLPGAIYTGCRPVRRDEVTFYEDREDE